MPSTIDQGFSAFLAKLTPTPGETQAAASHRASIRACLVNNFNLERFFETGSFGNGTSVSGYSDVDYFASIPRENLKQDSGSTLTQVRDALDTRFPNTGVRTNCPAVRVPFGTDAKETTEVVPADYVSTSGGYKVYEIANCAGGWMQSSPETHNAYVSAVDTSFAYKVKPLVRFVKAWKFYQNVPISSFYLELRIAAWAQTQGSIIYDEDIYTFLYLLQSSGLAAFYDPKGISGLIAACPTQAKLEDAKSKLATAVTRAGQALEARRKGYIESAFGWWDLVYAYKFPSYSA